MKNTFLFIALVIFATTASAHVAEKVTKNLKIEGDWCSGTYNLVVLSVKKEGTWQWKYNGTVLSNETGAKVNMALYGLGNYEVTQTDTNGKIIFTDSFKLATLPGPKADFGFDYLYAAGAVKFKNLTASNTTDLSWTWNFGDGSTSTDQYPTHHYKTEGTYLVQLTATDANGCSNTVTMEVVWRYPRN